MPFIHVHMLQGRSPEQIKTLIAELTATAARVLEIPADRVRMEISEVPKTHWGIGGITAHDLGR